MSGVTQTTGDRATETAAHLRLSVTRLARLLRQQDIGGLSPSQIAILATIEREGSMTLGDLASHERVAPPTVTKAVDKLVALGFVERRTHATDKRVCMVHLSAAGRRHLVATRNRRTAWLATRLRDLSADDLERLAAASAVLDRLAAAPQAGDEEQA
jgi:DNA-binding MarR family transcriptional regulator